GVGPTRSSICAEPESPELRLIASTWPKVVQLPPSPVDVVAAVRSMPASPNSAGFWSVSPPGATVSTTATWLTAASANMLALRLTGCPQHGSELALTSQVPVVIHRRAVRTGVVTPPVKSYRIRMSPAVRLTRLSDPGIGGHGVVP